MKSTTLIPALALAITAFAFAADEPRRGGKKGGAQGKGEGRLPTLLFRTEVPAQPVDVILGRPTTEGVTLSILSYEGVEGYVAYGAESGELTQRTAVQKFAKSLPVEITLGGLRAGTRYAYEFRSRAAGEGEFRPAMTGAFTTARAPGSEFVFTVQADPHLDAGTDPEVYKKSLANVLAARADFHVDLGDTFMTDKRTDYRDALPQYLAQRHYFGLVGHSVPVFLVLGNHDGEQPGKGRDSEAMAVWSNATRKKYFPNPEPNAFYTGSATPHPKAGLLQNYYAFEWGDALFIALDPYWYSQERGRGGSGDNWGRSLGREQYEWLRATLERSRARFTFVFIHHLVGGETREGRGGAEAAAFFEWGGRDLDGSDVFAEKRRGWAEPIHSLLVRRRGGVVVFHGHDHLYVQQERDGVIYQLVPQPGHARFDNIRSAAEYGYKSGVIQGASGIMRVNVTPETALVDYVRAYPTQAEDDKRKTGAVTHRYTVAPAK
ncbi:MAG: metallophosphoesterase [Opitutaceae bacterium]|nr:metallophosphoesterase [Opitutaceae bacterium]